jgi:hypothetical protein
MRPKNPIPKPILIHNKYSFFPSILRDTIHLNFHPSPFSTQVGIIITGKGIFNVTKSMVVTYIIYRPQTTQL